MALQYQSSPEEDQIRLKRLAKIFDLSPSTVGNVTQDWSMEHYSPGRVLVRIGLVEWITPEEANRLLNAVPLEGE